MDILEFIKKMQEMYGDDVITTADKINRPEPKPIVKEIEAFNEFMRRNPKADGGQLVAPSVDGSRPGYQGPEKYVTPLRRKGFTGSKFNSVADPTYSDGRRRVKTKAYEKWLKEQHALPKPKITQFGTRREPGLLRIAEAFQKADITDDFEYLMRNNEATKAWEKYSGKKQRFYKKGMISTGDMVYINQLEKNPADLQFIAESLGEDIDWVLDKLDERSQYVEDVKGERLLEKTNPKYKKPRNDYLKVENWVQKNAKRYANPETFEKALIKRFGNKNQFVMDMKKGGSISSTYFSDGFKKMMLNSEPGSPVQSRHLKQFIKSSLYNFNPKIRKAVTEEIKGIFNSENLPKLRTEARQMLNNNKLLSKFGLNKAITGPYAKIIQAEIGQQMWDDITNFRNPRVGTQEMLKAFEQLVADEFKPMFKEASKAINYSKNNEWKKAKDTLGIADNIAWDHKVPSSVIDKGYADIIEYTKVNPTSANFNERIKNAQFDRKINKLITKYEGVNTLDQKVKIVEDMNEVKSNFNKKFGNYLDEVEIKLDEKGNLRFSSSAEPLTTKMDRVKMLQKSLQQEKGIVKMNAITKKLIKSGFRCGAQEGLTCKDPRAYTKSIMENMELAKQGDNAAIAKINKMGKLMKGFKGAAKWTGWGILTEIGFAAPLAAVNYAKGANKDEIISNITYGLAGKSIDEQLKEKYAGYGQAQKLFDLYDKAQRSEELINEQGGYRSLFTNLQREEDAYKAAEKAMDPFMIPTPHLEEGRYFDENKVFTDLARDESRLADYMKEREKTGQERMEKMQPVQFYTGAKYGGLIGDKSGPAPTGGPMSQGLRSLYNNGRKL
jgi:hypothetical protein